MQQEDYILREIEKIGTIFHVIRLKLFGGSDNLSITIEKQVDVMSEMLKEINFDFDKFIALNEKETENYLKKFEGFNLDNIEKFADCLYDMGSNGINKLSEKYLIKALELFQMLNVTSETYSFEREKKILQIKRYLDFPRAVL